MSAADLKGFEKTELDSYDKKTKVKEVGKFSTAEHGTLYVEATNEDGEIVEMPIAASKLVSHANKERTSDHGEGASALMSKLMTGLSSVLNVEGFSGGKIGYKETANGPVKWLSDKDRFPTGWDRSFTGFQGVLAQLPDNFLGE